jgi:cytochrome c553
MEFSSRRTPQWQDRWLCWGKSILIILLISEFLWCGSIANATAATMEQGKVLFEQSCASCHSIDGTGASFGPDLKTVTQRRDRDWLTR